MDVKQILKEYQAQHTIKLVASDLDGTLLDKTGMLSEANRKAIQDLKARGIQFAIVTGRPYFSVGPLLSMWGIEGLVDVIIANNGLEIGIQATGELLLGEKLSVDAIHEILDLYKDIPGNFCFYGDNALYGQEMDAFMKRVSVKNHLPAYVEDLKTFIKKDLEKLLLACDPNDLEMINDFYLAHQSEMYRGFKSQDYLFEFMHPSVSKLGGIEKLAQHLGFNVEEVIAFGDNLNDLEMIQGSGFGVAMINGDPVVKAHAKIIAPHHDEDGFAFIIQKLMKNYEFS